MPSNPAPSIPGSSTSCAISMMKTKRRCPSKVRYLGSHVERQQGAVSNIRRETLGQRWLLKLACKNGNVFHVIYLNKSLQGRFTTVTNFADNLQASWWDGKIMDINVYMFEHISTVFQYEGTGQGSMGHLCMRICLPGRKSFRQTSGI